MSWDRRYDFRFGNGSRGGNPKKVRGRETPVEVREEADGLVIEESGFRIEDFDPEEHITENDLKYIL